MIIPWSLAQIAYYLGHLLFDRLYLPTLMIATKSILMGMDPDCYLWEILTQQHLPLRWNYQQCSWCCGHNHSGPKQTPLSRNSEGCGEHSVEYAAYCWNMWCWTYHSIPTIGSRAGTSADDFVYAFLVDGCVAFWKTDKRDMWTLIKNVAPTFATLKPCLCCNLNVFIPFKSFWYKVFKVFKWLYTHVCICSLACSAPCEKQKTTVSWCNFLSHVNSFWVDHWLGITHNTPMLTWGDL